MSASDADLTVEEVLRFEGLPPDSLASRHAVVRWSDGTEGEALRWYADEVLVCEGDLIGKTREQLRSLLSGGIATGFSPGAALVLSDQSLGWLPGAKASLCSDTGR